MLSLAACSVLSAQIPRIAAIDYYGIRKVPVERIRKALRLDEGDRLPASKAVAEEKLQEVPGVVLARLEAVCCTGDRAVLYVGIEERGAPHFEVREAPTGNAALPQDVVDAYRGFLRAFAEAARAGHSGENLSQGYPLADDPAARAFQEQFPAMAKVNLAVLRRVLHESADDEQRAIAAYVIGYSPDKHAAAAELQYAMRDPDPAVRENAIQTLAAVAVFAARKPELALKVQPTWFIEMLNSLEWSDRRRAADALVSLTESRDPAILEELRTRAEQSIVEMARWKTLAHALPAFLLAGRIAGVPENQILDAWNRADRESVLKRLNGK